MRLLSLLAAAALATAAPAQLSCMTVLHASSCGPTLTVTFTPAAGGNQRIDIAGAGLHPQSLLAIGVGVQPLTLPLPGGCALLIDPVWTELHTSDATGAFSWGRSWPHWLRAYLYYQMGTMGMNPVTGQYEVLTTDAIYGGCI